MLWNLKGKKNSIEEGKRKTENSQYHILGKKHTFRYQLVILMLRREGLPRDSWCSGKMSSPRTGVGWFECLLQYPGYKNNSLQDKLNAKPIPIYKI